MLYLLNISYLLLIIIFFFFNDTATTEIYTLSLHDALPISNVSSADILEKVARDPEKFWAEQARELEWIKPWDNVLEWAPPHAKRFTGGKINVSANCSDRQIRGTRRNKAALLWEAEPGERRPRTERELR